MLKHLAACAASMAIALPLAAQPASPASAAHPGIPIMADTHAMIASLGADLKRQQAELDAGLREATARANWSEQDRALFFRKVIASKPNQELDREIVSLTTELRGMLAASQRDEVRGAEANARYVARLRTLVSRLKVLYARQSAYIADQLRNVKAAPRRSPAS